MGKAKSKLGGKMRTIIYYGHSKPITKMQQVEHLIWTCNLVLSCMPEMR